MVIKKKSIATAVEATLEVSQSVIKAWRRCHQLYNYRYVQLLKRRKPIVYFIKGTMIGECLDAIIMRRTNPKHPHWLKSLEKFEKEYGKLFRAEQEYYGDIIGEVKRIVARYEKIYENDGFTYLMGKDGKPFELAGTVELAPGITFTFHIDKMPKDKQGRIWILDHKAFKKLPDPEDRFTALQLVFYYKAAPMAGYPQPTGVLWDYLRTKAPSIPPPLKRGGLSQAKDIDTDYETYLAEVKRLKLPEREYAAYLKPLKARGHMDFYQRVQLPAPNKALVENVWEDAKNTALEIQTIGKMNHVRSIDRTCKQCEFYNLCQAEFRGLDSSFIRKSEYQINKEPRHAHYQEEAE